MMIKAAYVKMIRPRISPRRLCKHITKLHPVFLHKRYLHSNKVGTEWSSIFAYLHNKNASELRTVTAVIAKKVRGNPLEKYYVMDNKVVLERIKSLTTHPDTDIRFNARQILCCVGVVPKQRSGIRLLSIDGGGTRGLVAISVLKKLEALTNKKVYEMFDFCIGTSTGALLIALMIAKRKPLDEVLDIYMNLSKTVFGGRSVLAVGRFVWKQHRYSTQTWEDILKAEFDEKSMSDVSCLEDSPLVAFVSSVVNHEVVHPYVFSEVPEPEAEDISFSFSDESDNEDDLEKDPDFCVLDEEEYTDKKQVTYNLSPLFRTVSMASRLGVGNEALAKLLTCHNMDNGCEELVTQKKVRSQKTRVYKEAVASRKGTDAHGIYFDGKKDKDTLIRSSAGGNTHGKKDHYSVVLHFPHDRKEGEYVGFYKPEDGKGVSIASGLTEFVEYMSLNTEQLRVIGADGTSSNTGWMDGSIAHFQRIMKKPLFWAICSIHRAELPLRHLIEKTDGKTTGPEEFIGPIGKLLSEDLWELPVGDFENIAAPDFPVVSEEVYNSFSNDVKYLYRVCLAAISGVVPDELLKLMIGPLCHSRWFTTASRIVRLYISGTCVLPLLKRFANYVVNVYVKTHMEIKIKNSISYGAKHLLRELQLMRANCNEQEKSLTVPVLQTNSYYAHPEAILLSMLADGRIQVREKAILMIQEIRDKSGLVKRSPRKFLKPLLNTDASEVWELATIKRPKQTGKRLAFRSEKGAWVLLTEPPVTVGMDLTVCRDNPLVFTYPCHSQTSGAVSATVKYESQLGTHSLLWTQGKRSVAS